MKEFYSTAAERRLTLQLHAGRRRPGDGTPGRPEIVLERSIARRIFLQVGGQS